MLILNSEGHRLSPTLNPGHTTPTPNSAALLPGIPRGHIGWHSGCLPTVGGGSFPPPRVPSYTLCLSYITTTALLGEPRAWPTFLPNTTSWLLLRAAQRGLGRACMQSPWREQLPPVSPPHPRRAPAEWDQHCCTLVFPSSSPLPALGPRNFPETGRSSQCQSDLWAARRGPSWEKKENG